MAMTANGRFWVLITFFCERDIHKYQLINLKYDKMLTSQLNPVLSLFNCYIVLLICPLSQDKQRETDPLMERTNQGKLTLRNYTEDIYQQKE